MPERSLSVGSSALTSTEIVNRTAANEQMIASRCNHRELCLVLVMALPVRFLLRLGECTTRQLRAAADLNTQQHLFFATPNTERNRLTWSRFRNEFL